MKLTSREDISSMVIDIRTWAPDRARKHLHGIRNAMTIKEHELVRKERDLIANELRVWMDDETRNDIRMSKKEDLVKFCSFLNGNLGMCIRNEFELWIREHHITRIWHDAEKKYPLATLYDCLTVDAGNGIMVDITSTSRFAVDDHPCHPDNFSFSCIERLWEMLQPW